MNLIWLEDFVALADTGNFSRAAEDRHSSQPAFSRRIRALEEGVGADLFDRKALSLARLTEVGELFADIAQDLIARSRGCREKSRRSPKPGPDTHADRIDARAFLHLPAALAAKPRIAHDAWAGATDFRTCFSAARR